MERGAGGGGEIPPIICCGCCWAWGTEGGGGLAGVNVNLDGSSSLKLFMSLLTFNADFGIEVLSTLFENT